MNSLLVSLAPLAAFATISATGRDGTDGAFLFTAIPVSSSEIASMIFRD
jgi:hypothetical protein